MSDECWTCVAAASASDETLGQLVRRQAVTISRLRDRLDSFGLARAEARVRELEETLQRVNRAQPRKAAVEVCRQVAATDPRDLDSLRCQWCGMDKHRPDCAWVQATVVADRAGKQERADLIDRWRTG